MKTFYKIALFVVLLAAAGSVFGQQTEREKGIELYKQGGYAQAADVLERVSKQKDAQADGEVWNYLGLAYVNLGESKKGVKALEKAVKISPQSADFRTNLAYAFLSSRKIDRAQAEIKKAIELDPKNVGAYYVRGTANLWEGDTGGALNDAEKTIEMDKNFTAGYILKSDALVALFGKNVSSDESDAAKVETVYLQKSVDTLEQCLQYCRNNPDLTALSERLEAAKVFYDYFTRRNARIDSGVKTPIANAANRTRAKITFRPQPKYTNKARQNNIQGTVVLYVMLAASGKISHIIVLKRLGHGLDEQAVIAAKQIRFEPATENGKPVSIIVTVTYSFSIH